MLPASDVEEGWNHNQRERKKIQKIFKKKERTVKLPEPDEQIGHLTGEQAKEVERIADYLCDCPRCEPQHNWDALRGLDRTKTLDCNVNFNGWIRGFFEASMTRIKDGV